MRGPTFEQSIYLMMLGGCLSDDRPTVEDVTSELGIAVGDYDYSTHWPRFCARRARAATDAVLSEYGAEGGSDS